MVPDCCNLTVTAVPIPIRFPSYKPNLVFRMMTSRWRSLFNAAKFG